MKRQLTVRLVCGLSLIAGTALFAGCHKNVAAAPPTPSTQPAPSQPAPTISLRATPDALDRGQATTLQWTAQNATSVRIEPEVGTVSNNGNRAVTPASSVTYTATATGPGGNASDAVRVSVRVPTPPAERAPARTDTNVTMQDLFARSVLTVYFDYDKSDIRSDQVTTLRSDAEFLKAHPGIQFTVEGHCDDRGSEEYNLGLGDRRANSVKDFLLKEGVSASSINTISYGAERPVCSDENESCYQKNRNAGFALKSGS